LAIAIGLLEIVERDDRQDRSEDLFLRDAHVGRHAVEQRRLEDRTRPSAGSDGRAPPAATVAPSLCRSYVASIVSSCASR
jgi:hypothetical protein